MRARPNAMLAGLGGVTLALHLLTNGGYGYFRDEFYYIACSEHLAAGYVDHPPLSILLLRLSRRLFGDSLPAIRFFPALAGALLVVLTGLMARELGGGRFAQFLAAVAVIVAPGYLVVGNFFSMNAFEPLLWASSAYILIRLINTEKPKLWVAFGIVAGLALENKHSMLFFGFGLFVALLLTPQRRYLTDKWLWLGVGIAGLIFLPNILWQIAHHWPTLEFLRNAQRFKNAPVPLTAFFAGQALIMQPLALPIWLAGLVFFFTAAGRRYRLLGWIYIVVVAVFIIAKAKVYYLMPIYPMLLAAGAIAIERFSRRMHRNWLGPAYAAMLLLAGVVTAPMALPVLPVETFVRYARFLGLDEGAKQAVSERQVPAQLPQYFADMYGWNELVAAVAQAYNSLPPADRSRVAIYAQNYGEAGAIDFLGKAYGLPHAISGHNSYWLWGPHGYSGEVAIVLGPSAEQLAAYFDSVTQVGVVRCGYCMPYENNRPIYLCKHPKKPFDEMWLQLKLYI